MHLSHPPGSSVNNGIDNAHFLLRYSTVNNAIDSIMRLGRGALMAKIDVKSAFRLCPVHPSDHHLLGMRWNGQFYYDQVLPYGFRSAPFIFNCLADALEWIAIDRGVRPIHHYLDDFFVAGAPCTDRCTHHLHTLTSLCAALRIPLAGDKRDEPTTCLEYQGALPDSALHEARLPPNELQAIHVSLATWADRHSCSKRELLSLIGTLSFAAKVAPACRTFLRRMIDLSSSVASLDDTITISGQTSDGGENSPHCGMASSCPTGPLLPTSSSSQSIKLYLSAIRMLHLEHGLPVPTSDSLNLCRLMGSIKRVHGNAADSRLSVTPSLLRSFRSFLNLSYPDHLSL